MFGTVKMPKCQPNGPIIQTAKGFIRAYLVPNGEGQGFSIVKIFSKSVDVLKEDVTGLEIRFGNTDFVFAKEG